MHFKSLYIATLGIVLILIGIPTVIYRNLLFQLILDYASIIQPDSFAFQFFQTPPMPLKLYIYFYNWTNPEDIFNTSTKPIFKEVGPYTFTEHRERVNITWNDNNQTITFRFLRYWKFDGDTSPRNLSDVITTLNTVSLSSANQVKDWSDFMKGLFSYSMLALAPELHVQKTIDELLFEGYRDPFIDIALTFPYLVDTLPPEELFGYMKGRNNSFMFEGTYNINNDNLHGDFGKLLNWNYENTSKYYESSCSNIDSSVGDIFPRHLEKNNVNIFLTDSCRPVKMDYEEEIEVKNILGYKYSAGVSMLDNGTQVPKNKCFCNGECVPSGLLNISSCRYGTPSFISLPHFYNADPSYLNLVDGLAPEKSKHEMFVVLEPNTGLPLDGFVRLQLNFRLFPMEDVWLYSKVPTLFFPIFWFEQNATIPDFVAWKVRVALHLPKTIFPITGCIFIIVGITLLTYYIKFFLKTLKWQNKKYEIANVDNKKVGRL